MRITLIFTYKRDGNGNLQRKTVQIINADQLKKLAEEHGFTKLTPCVARAGGGFIEVEGKEVKIHDDSPNVPLPINALLQLDNIIDECRTFHFFAQL